MRKVLLAVLCACSLAPALSVRDTVLFSLKLSADSTALDFCDRNVAVRRMLAGPMLVEGGLLFYSINGFALYDSAGTLLESHDARVEPVAKKGVLAEPALFVCVLDSSTLLYAAKTTDPKKPLAFYTRKLLKNRFKEAKEEEAATLKGLLGGAVVNMARGCHADEMAPRVYLRPQLVAFTGLEAAQNRWWSLDRFYTFSSPLIQERDSQFVSFFPGFGASRKSFKDKAVDIVGTYLFDGRRRYVGVWAPMGGEAWETKQQVFICDHAGNVMIRDSIPKQTNTEIIIGRDDSGRKPTLFYAKATKSFSFPPVLDNHGRLYYCVMDFDERTMKVHRRSYAAFAPKPSEPDLAHLIDIEKDISFEPLSLPCASPQQMGAMIPLVRFTSDKGERRTADVRDLTRGEYLVRITRQVYRDIEVRLARGRSALPPRVEKLRDSIGTIATAGCPYAISISGPKGVLRMLDYGLGEEVLCARVIAVRASGDIVVRVDLENYAEALVFEPDGTLASRFVFNRQQVTQRNDVIVALGDSPVLEFDLELDPIRGRYLAWDAR